MQQIELFLMAATIASLFLYIGLKLGRKLERRTK
jgi:hypothetical protein